MSCATNKGQVISLLDFQDRMKHPQLQEIEAYWEGLRFGRTMPVRSEVDPRGLSRSLENTFILERVAPGVVRFRVAGQHLYSQIGMELRGMPLSALVDHDDRAGLAQAVEEVFSAPARLRLSLSAQRGIGRPSLQAQMLVLPLRDDQGLVSRALGCFVSDGRGGRGPRRFTVTRQQVTALEVAPRRQETPRPRAFAEDPAPFNREKGPDNRPALHIVSNNE